MNQVHFFFLVFAIYACSGDPSLQNNSQGGNESTSTGGSPATTMDSQGGTANITGGASTNPKSTSNPTSGGVGGVVTSSTTGGLTSIATSSQGGTTPNGTGGASTNPGTTTGGSAYKPCECKPYVSIDAVAKFEKGDAGVDAAMYEAWSTLDRRDVVKGTLQVWHGTAFLQSGSYLAPIDEVTTATILPVDQAERKIRLSAVLCAETQNITGAPDPYQTFYFLDGTSVEGHVYDDDYLYVVGTTTSVSVFAPHGLSGGVPLRICFRRLSDSEI